MIENIKFIHLLSTTLLVELFMIFIFRYTNQPFSGVQINKWYDKYRFGALLIDTLSVIIGFYITIFIYKKLKIDKKIKNNLYKFLVFLGIVLCVQITHDILFYFLIINPYPKYSNIMIDSFKKYADSIKGGAIIGDSFMYIISIPILYFMLNKSENFNLVTSIVALYILGYMLYQKPLYVKY